MDCMTLHKDESGFVYNSEGILIICSQSLVDTIFDVHNSLVVRARIKRDPIAMYFYARIIDDYYCKYREAVEYYKEAAEAGVVPAVYNLAMCYIAGDGVEKNTAEAVAWLEKGAEYGNPSCLFKLGMLYDMGAFGLKQNAYKAAFYYEEAAKENHPIAQNNIAYWYCNRVGVSEEDIQNAVRWYKASAENGYKPAQQWCIHHGIRFSTPAEFSELVTEAYTKMMK